MIVGDNDTGDKFIASINDTGDKKAPEALTLANNLSPGR
jgi:hypothetical protein